MNDPRWHEIERRSREIREQIAKLAEAPRMLAIPDPDGKTVHVISRDLEDPQRWRASRFDQLGPAGHVGPTSYASALRAARDYGADIMRAVEVTPQTIDAVTRDWIGPLW